jgi:hypothetical protein
MQTTSTNTDVELISSFRSAADEWTFQVQNANDTDDLIVQFQAVCVAATPPPTP